MYGPRDRGAPPPTVKRFYGFYANRVDAAPGQPAAGTNVYALPDGDGLFRFDALQPGRYRVRGGHRECTTRRSTSAPMAATVRAGETTEVMFAAQ